MCGQYDVGLWVRGCTGKSHHLIVSVAALGIAAKLVPLILKPYVFAVELYESDSNGSLLYTNSHNKGLIIMQPADTMGQGKKGEGLRGVDSCQKGEMQWQRGEQGCGRGRWGGKEELEQGT
jgi:hypothetical protein